MSNQKREELTTTRTNMTIITLVFIINVYITLLLIIFYEDNEGN